MTDREKIAEILNTTETTVFDNVYRLGKKRSEILTDALIAAGIGDVSGKNRVRIDERDEERLLDILKKAFKEQAKSLAEYGFSNTSEQIILKVFDEVNLEYKHRAEVAERALKNYIDNSTMTICPVGECSLSECDSDECKEAISDYYMAQAERELNDDQASSRLTILKNKPNESQRKKN